MTSDPARGIRSCTGTTGRRAATRTYRLREGEPARDREPANRSPSDMPAATMLGGTSRRRASPGRAAFLSYGRPTSCSASAPGQVAVALLRVYRYRFLAERSACRLALDHRGLSERHPVDPSRRRLSPDRQLQRADHRPPDLRHPGEPDSRADHCVLPQAEHRALNTRAADTMIAFDSERLLRMLDPGTACDPVTHHEQHCESSSLTVLRKHSAVAPGHRCFGLGGVGST